ncbi:AAA family ATPase [Paraburkholderia pallida]|uniref:AAA family ATPase n=1 Tax=Paraburkholderia pallida TaxID=2547399 RepID=A0A4P7D8M9_9BURK|nr:AAA family ATPase [Paraburkholderia pallida]QBR03184.1 AAA family ATPase [Paraburkholderia pallida]
MNATPLAVHDDGPEGVYTRGSGEAREWWRVSLSERANMFRIEHGRGGDGDAIGDVDIDTVVDLDNLEAKLLKWRREGFVSDAGREDEARAAEAGSRFSAELRRAAAAARAAREGGGARGDAGSKAGGEARLPGATVRIGNVDMPVAQAGSLASQALVPRINDAYLFTARTDDVALDIIENRRVMLIGHTGSGKTSFIEQVAARTGHGVLRANMNGQTTIGDFVGFWTVKGGETVWVDGVLPVAMREGYWLIIDELDFAEPSILAVLTAVLEPNGKLLLKERGNEIVTPHPAFRLFATANAAGAMSAYRHLYQGANLLNEAFLDRWRVYLFDYLPKNEEAEVLRRTLPQLTPALAQTLAAIAADCRAAFAHEDLASAFSTRRLIDWAELMLRTGDAERAAGPSIYAKVSAEDAALIRSIIRHHAIFDADPGAS